MTWHRKRYDQLFDQIEVSLDKFHHRRVLLVSWVLTVSVGIFGNMFGSAIFGTLEQSSLPFALPFLIASLFSAGLLFWFFSPNFEHEFPIWYGDEASDTILNMDEKFGPMQNEDKLDAFFRVHHLLLLRDSLHEWRERKRLTRITDVAVVKQGYQTWITVRLGSSTAWLRKSIEKELRQELELLCRVFATTILPIRWFDETTPIQQVKDFDNALSVIDFERVGNRIVEQILLPP